MNVVRRLTDTMCDRAMVIELRECLNEGRLQANKVCRKIFARSPAPPFKESVEYLYPHLVEECDYDSMRLCNQKCLYQVLNR